MPHLPSRWHFPAKREFMQKMEFLKVSYLPLYNAHFFFPKMNTYEMRIIHRVLYLEKQRQNLV